MTDPAQTRPAAPARGLLIVEDEALIAMMLEDMVIDLGHSVLATCDSCTGALAFLATPPADLGAAILDVNLGADKSWPVADRLVALGIPYAFASGGHDRPPAPHDQAPGLPKPFALRDVEQVVGGLLNGA